MATSDLQFCSLCKEDDMNIDAVKWCTECETFLCLDCDKHHSKNKSSKQHKTLPSNDYQKLPDFIINTPNRCPDHDQRYDLYCPNHSAACCVQCFTENHQNCKDLKRLPDILKDMKSSASMSRLEKDLSIAIENCESITLYLKGRLPTILKQETKGIEEIRLVRKSINEHLDNLEQTMIIELDLKHTQLKAKTEKLMNQIETKRRYLKKIQDDNDKIKNYATELQTFIGLKEISKMTTEEVAYLQKLTQSGELDELHMEVKISSDIKSALQKLICFGSVSVTSFPCSLDLNKEAGQIPNSFHSVKMIQDINPILNKKFALPKMKSITGCQILPNGLLLFLYRLTKQLIQCNYDGTNFVKVITFKDVPLSLCFIKDTTVAVTVPDRHQILEIDIDTREITTTIQREKKCLGIDSNGDIIVVLERDVLNDHAIFLDLEGIQLRCIEMEKWYWESIALFGNKLYCTNWKTNKVLCMQDDGTKLWEIDNKEFDRPIGIGVDHNNFIYVASSNNNRIFVISPDDLTIRILLAQQDGIQIPTDISVDRNTQTLLVYTRFDRFAFMYQI